MIDRTSIKFLFIHTVTFKIITFILSELGSLKFKIKLNSYYSKYISLYQTHRKQWSTCFIAQTDYIWNRGRGNKKGFKRLIIMNFILQKKTGRGQSYFISWNNKRTGYVSLLDIFKTLWLYEGKEKMRGKIMGGA